MLSPNEDNVYLRSQEGEEAHAVPAFYDSSLEFGDAGYFKKGQLVTINPATGLIIKTSDDTRKEKVAVARGRDLFATAGSINTDCPDGVDYTLITPLRDEYTLTIQTLDGNPDVPVNTPSIYHGQLVDIVSDANGDQFIDLATVGAGRFQIVIETTAFQRRLRLNKYVQTVKVRVLPEYQLF